MTELKLVIYGFEYYNQADPENRPIPVVRFKVQFPSGAQADPTWPADAEDQEIIKEILDRFEPKIIAQLDPNAAPGFVPEGLDDGFRKDS